MRQFTAYALVLFMLSMLAVACAPSPNATPTIPVVATMPPEASTAAPEGDARKQCEQRVATFSKRLRAAASRPAQLGFSIKVARFSKKVGWRIPEMSMGRFEAAGFSIDGRPQSGPAEALASLEKTREVWRIFNAPAKGPDHGWRLGIEAPGDMPLEKLASWLPQLAAAKWSLQLIVRVPDVEAIPIDPPAWMQRVLTRLRSQKGMPLNARMEAIRAANRQAVGDCEPLWEALAKVRQKGIDPGAKPDILAEGLPPAVLACECRPDVAALEALWVSLFAWNIQRHRVLPLPIDPKAKATLTLRKDTTVQELAERLAARKDLEAPFKLELK